MTFQEWIFTVDNVSGIIMAGMMIIQVIFIGFTFWFGSRYLEQHKEKVLLEKKLVIIYDTISLLTEYIQVYNESVTIPPNKLREIWNENTRTIEKVKELIIERKRKIKSFESRLFHLKKRMDVNLLLIDSSKLDERWKGIENNIKKIEERYWDYESRFYLFSEQNYIFGIPRDPNSESFYLHFSTLSHTIFDSKITQSVNIISLYNIMLNDFREIYFDAKL